MPRVNLQLEDSIDQEEVDEMDVIAIAKQSDSVFVNADIAMPGLPAFWEEGEIGWESEPDCTRLKQPIAEYRQCLETFEEVVSSRLSRGYFGKLTEDSCSLGNEYGSYEEAKQEAIELEKSLTCVKSVVAITVYPEGVSDEIIEVASEGEEYSVVAYLDDQ